MKKIFILSLLFGFFANASAQEAYDFQFGLLESSTTTTGAFRFPNSVQADQVGNVFGDVTLKQNIVLAKQGKTKFSIYGQANYTRDTFPYDWNNSSKLTLGATLSTRIGDHLSLTLSARQEYYSEIHTDNELSAFRYGVSYYYGDQWKAETAPNKDEFGFLKSTLKSYGAITFPASLEPGNSNITIIQGAEYAWQYQMPNSNFVVAPLVSLNVDWDKEQLSYNNKLKAAVGAKIIYSLAGGELYAGAKYEADYRPFASFDNFVTGPQIYFGWYKTWNQKF